ncbi:hypothetical protein F5B17DRAFT_369399 [Nemania serpens]|nr:hypothetical protein F5B17DRAFT_369399 [Nemania serpens]
MDIDSDSDYRASDSEDDDQSTDDPPAPSPKRQSLPIRRKRRAEGPVIAPPGPSPPLKRAKGEFNAAYLELLNRDIQDASSGLIHGEEDVVAADSEDTTLIGAVEWSAAEKNLFFAALSRRGRDDVEGISAGIATKSEVEVQQYLVLLDATGQRQRDSEGKVKGRGKGAALRPVDVPAAVEIGAECDGALEAAADALSLRQESYEEEVERKRWGSRWRVTASLAQSLEESLHGRQGCSATSVLQPQSRESGLEEQRADDEDESHDRKQLKRAEKKERARILDEMPFLDLFSLQNWVHLSDRVFMNSAVSDGNWRAVSEEHEPPAIQATAFAHFHRLVVSVVKRLLLAAMYMAESRMRKEGFGDGPRRAKPRVRAEDVAAAASLLGMKQDSREFWARCARRLRLHVVDDEIVADDGVDNESEDAADTESGEDTDGEDQLSTLNSEAEDIEETEPEPEESDEDGYEMMSYDEVEAALGFPAIDTMRSRPQTPETASEFMSDALEEGTGDERHGDDDLEDDENESDARMEDGQETPKNESDSDLNSVAMQQDLEEAMISLVSSGPTSSRPALITQIRAEHRLERDAEQLDLQASVDAETKLRAVLRGDDGESRPRRRKSRTRQENRM